MLLTPSIYDELDGIDKPPIVAYMYNLRGNSLQLKYANPSDIDKRTERLSLENGKTAPQVVISVSRHVRNDYQTKRNPASIVRLTDPPQLYVDINLEHVTKTPKMQFKNIAGLRLEVYEDNIKIRRRLFDDWGKPYLAEESIRLEGLTEKEVNEFYSLFTGNHE